MGKFNDAEVILNKVYEVTEQIIEELTGTGDVRAISSSQKTLTETSNIRRLTFALLSVYKAKYDIQNFQLLLTRSNNNYRKVHSRIKDKIERFDEIYKSAPVETKDAIKKQKNTLTNLIRYTEHYIRELENYEEVLNQRIREFEELERD